MPQDLQEPFLTDLAYTLIDVGKLSDSNEAFLQAHRILEGNTTSFAALATSHLNLAMVCTAQDKTREARRWLEEAKANIDQLPPGKISDELSERHDARLAHVIFLEGDRVQDALKIFKRLERPEERPTISGERAHAYVAALGLFRRHVRSDHVSLLDVDEAVRWKPEVALDRALEVCISNLYGCAFAKRNHEALGFAIAHARLMRVQNLLGAAEAALDQVYLDILRYGCSERTYVEFLREAGSILNARGNPARAYAAYLSPCFDRALANGMARIAQTTGKLALRVLRTINANCDRAVSPQQWKADLESALSPPSFLELAGKPQKASDGSAPDPHFSFDLTDISEWIRKLGSTDEIDAEIASLKTELDNLLADGEKNNGTRGREVATA